VGRLRLRLGCVGALGLLMWSGCSQEPPGGARHVVLVTVDTLRADHVGAYGYPRPTSPEIDAFRRGATLYSRAQSASPWTLPTHASLFTGLDPFEHGAHTERDESGRALARPLAPAHVTLAEALRDEGFRTGAFVANSGYLDARMGLDQGFETYEVQREPGVEKNARIAEWLDADSGQPFFLFVNYMDAHRPYNTAPVEGGPETSANLDPKAIDRLYQAVMPGDRPLAEALVREVTAQYDLGVANADRAVGALLELVRDRGLEDETLFVITSDHGEYFGEHDLVEHSKDVYQEALWVPLLIRDAGQRAPALDDVPFASAHLPRRIAAGLPPEVEARLALRFPRRAGVDPVVAENYYARERDLRNPGWGHRFERVRRAVFEWPLKWIQSSDGADELFDLDVDPAERRDLGAARPKDAARLRALLEDRLSRLPDSAPPARVPAPGEDERRELEALGYLDS
jgi:arylsulfatase A-like enzyme